MLTILVIEDHVITLETICLILKKQGYEALAAKNAQEAQEHFSENKVDLVIVDHGLPGITGSELAKCLKEVKSVLVLMLSGDPELVGKPEAIGCSRSQSAFQYCWPPSKGCSPGERQTAPSRRTNTAKRQSKINVFGERGGISITELPDHPMSHPISFDKNPFFFSGAFIPSVPRILPTSLSASGFRSLFMRIIS